MRLLILALALGLAACITAPPAPISDAELRGLTVAGVFDQPVRLTAGTYEGPPFVAGGAARPRLTLADTPQLRADLDGDGREEAAVLLIEQSGGSGERLYLAVVERERTGAHNRATLLVGDRVQVRAFRLKGRQLILELIAAGPGDAACCPSRKQRRAYRLDAKTLVLARSEDQGRIGLADLEGPVWRLSHLDLGQTLPPGVEVQAQFRTGELSGFAGCNRYGAQVRHGDGPEGVNLVRVISSRKLCPDPQMAVEDRYLAALRKVTGFRFRLGQLALDYGDGQLLFDPVVEPEVP